MASKRPPSSSNQCMSKEELATKYLEDHKIVQLIENMAASLFYHRPENPKEFMKQHIQQLLRAKSNPDEVEPPCLMNESNLISIYYMLDITKKGHISKELYLLAMAALGVKKFNENPSGADLDKITLETFLRESKASLRVASATYIEA